MHDETPPSSHGVWTETCECMWSVRSTTMLQKLELSYDASNRKPTHAATSLASDALSYSASHRSAKSFLCRHGQYIRQRD
jgi:hypothetical protein